MKNDELSLLLSPPEGDVRASLVLAKYKFCGHKFNNKTYKMKKFLLFLSCFLITWCSVQAATPSGKITSATYNASSSTIDVSYTSSGANSVYMDVICMRTGPVSRVTLNSGPGSKTINLPITSRDGEYDLVLYVNGTPCYDKKVNVTKYGHLNNVTATKTGVVTVNYTMLHAETDNYPNNSYLKIGNNKHYITNVKNGSYTWGLNLKPGTYTCEIYVDGVCKHTCPVTVPSYVDAIRKLTPMGSRLKIDFTLSQTGVNVGFRVTVAKLSGTPTGGTQTYNYGICDQNEGTYEISVPYYTGQVIYAVELLKNGTSVNGNSITVYNR